MSRHTKPWADLLTVSRTLLGVYLAGLGVKRGTEALPTAVLIVIISWLTDVLDGPFARHDPDHRSTWVGEHDAEADLTVSLGVVAYLVLSGYLAGWLGAVLVLTILGLWVLHSHQLAWPAYALPYAILILLAFQDVPLFGWLAVGYLLATLVVCRSRFWQQYLPEFFQALDSLHRGNGQHTPNAHNGQI